MASDTAQVNPHVSMRNGCRCVVEPGVSVEDVLVVVGELIGFENILSASRMNKAIVVFLKTEQLVNQLTESGIWINETFVPVTPLAAPATKVTISNVPPFISNEAIIKELIRYGKIASPVRMIPLGCKNTALKHVLSFRRQVLMFLTSPERTLEISFRVSHGESSYMLYASTDNLKCFECGNLGHKRFYCPHKKVDNEQPLPVVSTESGSSKENNSSDIVEITTAGKKVTEKRPAERIIGDNEVSESDGEKAGCSYAVVRHSNHEVEDVVENVTQTDVQTVEEGSVDELDGMSQCTDDSMKDDDQWVEGVDMPTVAKEDLYTVAEISEFLDETKGRKVEVSDFFPDLEKFITSVMWARRHSNHEELSQQKRFRLRKHITAIRHKGKTEKFGPKRGKKSN